jgi:hypothetical protein
LCNILVWITRQIGLEKTIPQWHNVNMSEFGNPLSYRKIEKDKETETLRQAGTDEPTLVGGKDLSPQEIERQKKIVNWLSGFLKKTEIYDKTDWPPQEILNNRKLKNALIDKLPKNFPYLELDQALETLSKLRIKI